LLRSFGIRRAPDSGPAQRRLLAWYTAAGAAVGRVRPRVLRLVPPGDLAQVPALPDNASALSFLNGARDAMIAALGPCDDPYAWCLADVLRGYFALRDPTVPWAAAVARALRRARAADA